MKKSSLTKPLKQTKSGTLLELPNPKVLKKDSIKISKKPSVKHLSEKGKESTNSTPFFSIKNDLITNTEQPKDNRVKVRRLIKESDLQSIDKAELTPKTRKLTTFKKLTNDIKFNSQQIINKVKQPNKVKSIKKPEDLCLKSDTSQYCSTGVSPTNDANLAFESNKAKDLFGFKNRFLREEEEVDYICDEEDNDDYVDCNKAEEFKQLNDFVFQKKDTVPDVIFNINQKLKRVQADSFIISKISNVSRDSNNLMNEQNQIRRETFIDNNFNKKPFNNIKSNEVFKESDVRLKRYEILLDFINNNINEINQKIVQTNPNNILPQDSFHNRVDAPTLEKIEELSSLKSSFNNHQKSINGGATAMIESGVAAVDISSTLNYLSMKFDITPRDSFNKYINNSEINTKSVLVSSSTTEIYKNFFGEITENVKIASFLDSYQSFVKEELIENIVRSFGGSLSAIDKDDGVTTPPLIMKENLINNKFLAAKASTFQKIKVKRKEDSKKSKKLVITNESDTITNLSNKHDDKKCLIF